MTKYNWDERHIITFPEEKLALATKTFMFTMAKKKLSRELICSLKKQNYGSYRSFRMW